MSAKSVTLGQSCVDQAPRIAMRAMRAMRESWEPDYSDIGAMLESIGGWHVGCENHDENLIAVNKAKELGLVSTRMHYAPAIPNGSEAFELTDAGIDMVERLRGSEAKERAARQRQWYRDNAAKYTHEQQEK